MPRKQQDSSTLDQSIISVVRNNRPATLEELVKFVQLKHSLAEKEIMRRVLQLQNQGKLIFTEQPAALLSTPKGYIFSARAMWYWAIIASTLATSALVLTVPEDFFPIVYVRYLLGLLFVLFLPGYSLTKALFPAKELDNIERTALSIGLSLVLVSIAGLLLNYTYWGIRTTPLTLSMLALTITFATAAIVREHQTKLGSPMNGQKDEKEDDKDREKTETDC